MVKNNVEHITKKMDSLAVNMAAKSSIRLLKLPNAQANTDAFTDPFDLDADGTAIALDVWGVAIAHYSWSWGFNAWPYPGAPTMATPTTDVVYMKAISIKLLKDNGLTALSSVPLFLKSAGPKLKTICSEDALEIILRRNEVAFIPAGYIVIATALPEDLSAPTAMQQDKDKQKKAASLVLMPLFSKKLWLGVGPEIRNVIKQFMDTCFVENPESGYWNSQKTRALKFVATEAGAES